jgi:hypothetical protein
MDVLPVPYKTFRAYLNALCANEVEECKLSEFLYHNAASIKQELPLVFYENSVNESSHLASKHTLAVRLMMTKNFKSLSNAERRECILLLDREFDLALDNTMHPNYGLPDEFYTNNMYTEFFFSLWGNLSVSARNSIIERLVYHNGDVSVIWIAIKRQANNFSLVTLNTCISHVTFLVDSYALTLRENLYSYVRKLDDMRKRELISLAVRSENMKLTYYYISSTHLGFTLDMVSDMEEIGRAHV